MFLTHFFDCPLIELLKHWGKCGGYSVSYSYLGSLRTNTLECYIFLIFIIIAKFYVISNPSYPVINISDAPRLLLVCRRRAIIPQWEYHPAYPSTAHKLARVDKSPALKKVRPIV